MSEGRLVMWACLCSEVRETEDEIPETCPGHDRDRVAPPWFLADKPMTRGHRCLQRACDGREKWMDDHREEATA